MKLISIITGIDPIRHLAILFIVESMAAAVVQEDEHGWREKACADGQQRQAPARHGAIQPTADAMKSGWAITIDKSTSSAVHGGRMIAANERAAAAIETKKVPTISPATRKSAQLAVQE